MEISNDAFGACLVMFVLVGETEEVPFVVVLVTAIGMHPDEAVEVMSIHVGYDASHNIRVLGLSEFSPSIVC